METIFWILISTFAISLISFVGVATLMFKEKILNNMLMVMVALSAGALMGGAFLHLIPESLGLYNISEAALLVLVGFSSFFLIEKILHWRHCHEGKCAVHTFAYMNLVGDCVHNFIDGMIIAASFLVDINFGIVTTFMIAVHEIPQEIGDFGVLIYGGFKKSRALFMNFLTALTAVFGGIVGYFLASSASWFMASLLPFAAGGFIYIAASDLIPEIRKEQGLKRSLLVYSVFLIGILIMLAMRMMGAE